MVNTFYKPSPSTKRCAAFGRALAAAIESFPGDRRVMIVGSGGLSHTDIDLDLDCDFVHALETNAIEFMEQIPEEKLSRGTSEIKCWIVTAAAADRPVSMGRVPADPARGLGSRRRHGLRHLAGLRRAGGSGTLLPMQGWRGGTPMATTKSRLVQDYWHPAPLYERWLDTLDIPVHREYFVDDLRTLPLGPWEERECNAAIVVLAGQEGVTEARITEIPPGSTMPALKFSLDEIVYVLEGKGMCTVWAGEGRPKRSFEWQKHSLFMLPRSHFHQLSNMQGGQPTRLLHFNSLPVAMAVIPNVDYFFDNPHVEPERDMLDPELGDVYSQAQYVERDGKVGGFWMSNFFPDLEGVGQDAPDAGKGRGAAPAAP